MRWSKYLLVLLITGTVAQFAANAQSPQFKLGPVLWEMDSVGHFVVPSDADIVVVARLAPHAPDSNLHVLNARTGEVMRKLHGPILAEYSANRQSFEVSNDGHLCIVGDVAKIDGLSETTRAYDLTDGRLLWERKEIAGVFAVSSRLQRTVLGVHKYSGSPLSVHSQMEIVDTRDGHTISEFLDDWLGFTCFDEDHGRFYLPFKRWQGQEGSWVVEFDASNGEELRKWRVLQGPMVKMPEKDSLYILSSDKQQHSNMFQVSRLDLNRGTEVIVAKCDLSQLQSCFTGSIPTFRVSEGEHEVFSTGTFGAQGILSLEIDANTSIVEPLVMEPVIWEGKSVGGHFPHALNPSKRLFYFVPAGSGFDRLPFVCMSLVPSISNVASADADTSAFSVVVVDNILHINHNQLQGLRHVEIVDLEGQVLYARSISDHEATSDIELNAFPSGHYICRVVLSSRVLSKSFLYTK